MARPKPPFPQPCPTPPLPATHSWLTDRHAPFAGRLARKWGGKIERSEHWFSTDGGNARFMREFTFMRLATICGRNLSLSLVNLIGTEIQAKGDGASSSAVALDKRLKPGSRVIKFYGPAQLFWPRRQHLAKCRLGRDCSRLFTLHNGDSESVGRHELVVFSVFCFLFRILCFGPKQMAKR